MATFTTADLSRKVGDVIAAAHKGPVILTQHRKPRFVLMTVERYEVLRKRADARTTAKVADMPADLVSEVSTAIDSYLDNEAE